MQRKCQISEDISIETAKYISGIENDTTLFSQAVCSHWILDIYFREDESHLRTGDNRCPAPGTAHPLY